VLIDWLSASASEIIAWALDERGWATIIWTTSFGKGSIQTIHENEDKSSLKFTIWKWYTPNDENIDEVWITPEIEVEFDIEQYKIDNKDVQLDAAVDYLINNNNDSNE